MSDKKLAGLWIDGTKAIVVSNHDSQEVTDFAIVDTVKAEIQHGNSSENAANNAEQSNKLKFYKEIEKTDHQQYRSLCNRPGNFPGRTEKSSFGHSAVQKSEYYTRNRFTA
jgi:hypothetical protein